MLALVALQPTPRVAERVTLAHETDQVLVPLDAHHGRLERDPAGLTAPAAHRALREASDVVAEEVVLQRAAPAGNVGHPMPDDADHEGVNSDLGVEAQVEPAQPGKTAGDVDGAELRERLRAVSNGPGHEVVSDGDLGLTGPTDADDGHEVVDRPARDEALDELPGLVPGQIVGVAFWPPS